MDKVLQYFSYYDYSSLEIEYTIKTKKYSIAQLTDILKIHPTRGFSMDEPYEGRQLNTETGRVEVISRLRPYTFWVYNSVALTDSPRFEVHLELLLEKLDPQMTTIKNILLRSEDFEINVFIDLGIEVEHDYFGFSASSLSLKNLAEASHSIEWRFNQRKNLKPPV